MLAEPLGLPADLVVLELVGLVGRVNGIDWRVVDPIYAARAEPGGIRGIHQVVGIELIRESRELCMSVGRNVGEVEITTRREVKWRIGRIGRPPGRTA